MRSTFPAEPGSGLDPWLASSLLQKAIRRGEVAHARAAALRLLELRGPAVWRRLLVCAFEDVGPADPDAVVYVAGHAGGDGRAVVNATRILAGAPKDRSPEHLITAAMKAPSLEEGRTQLAAASSSETLAVVADESAALVKRAAATWFASGISLDAQPHTTPGDLSALLQSFRDLGVPASLVDATQVGARRLRDLRQPCAALHRAGSRKMADTITPR